MRTQQEIQHKDLVKFEGDPEHRELLKNLTKAAIFFYAYGGIANQVLDYVMPLRVLESTSNPCLDGDSADVSEHDRVLKIVDPDSCRGMMENATLSLVYDPALATDIPTIADNISLGYFQMTRGKGELDVSTFEFSDKSLASVRSEGCVELDLLQSPTPIAVLDNPEINDNDFVVGLFEEEACDDTFVGAAYTALGSRFANIFAVSDRQKKATVTALHELGHLVGLVHSSSLDGWMAKTDMPSPTGSTPYLISPGVTLAYEGVDSEYGDETSIMGRLPDAKSLFSDTQLTAQSEDLFTPFELDQVESLFTGRPAANELVMTEDTEAITLEIFDERNYVSIELPEAINIYKITPGDSKREFSSDFTTSKVSIRAEQSEKVPQIAVYLRDVKDSSGAPQPDLALFRYNITGNNSMINLALEQTQQLLPFTVDTNGSKFTINRL